MSDDEADREIDDIGVIARVAPEDKVHLVDVLKRKGHIVAMTGDGVNDAPALKKADIGVAMGITGTEVSKEAAVMILTDDNFATIVKAVELGRALYDNLLRYIRFQMAGLFGFIATFLGSSILYIAGGVPFLPLQTLWINFTVQVFLAIGLGLRQGPRGPDAGRAAPEDQRLLPRRLMTWVIFAGLVMAAVTLGGHPLGRPGTARRWRGRWASPCSRSSTSGSPSRRRTRSGSVFSREILENGMLIKMAGAVGRSPTVLATEFGLLQPDPRHRHADDRPVDHVHRRRARRSSWSPRSRRRSHLGVSSVPVPAATERPRCGHGHVTRTMTDHALDLARSPLAALPSSATVSGAAVRGAIRRVAAFGSARSRPSCQSAARTRGPKRAGT